MTPRTIGEHIIITIFAIVFLISLDFPTSMAVAILCLPIVFFFSNQKKWKKRINFYGFIMLVTLLVFFLTDSILTYQAVFIKKVAIEYGILPNLLWHYFGVLGGELIRILIFSAVFLGIYHNFFSKNIKKKVTAFILLVFCNLIFIAVITSNIIQLRG